jgi:hypothetical protein
MKIEKGKSYFLKINYQGRILEYEGKIVFLNEKEFGIQTDEECDLRFRLKDLIFLKEIEEKKKGETKIIVRKKGPLKEEKGPKGI